MIFEFYRCGKKHIIEVDEEDFYFLSNHRVGKVQVGFHRKTGKYYYRYYDRLSRKQESLGRILLRKNSQEFPDRIVHLDGNSCNFQKRFLGSKHDHH
jgi:hypothetical protein